VRAKATRLIEQIAMIADDLRDTGGVVSGEAAAHVHLAAATGSRPGELVQYSALAPRGIEAIFARPNAAISGVRSASGDVADVLRNNLDLFSTEISLADHTRVPVLVYEAVLAQLLSGGGLDIGLAGSLIRVTKRHVDVDAVREILKAARQGDRFQPLLELLDVA
jgi:hypothetical protein